MTPQEYASLLDYIRENNSWGAKMYEVNIERKRRAVKYVDAIYDSRDGRIYQITLRSCVPGGTQTIIVESSQDIARIYSWLNEEIK